MPPLSCVCVSVFPHANETHWRRDVANKTPSVRFGCFWKQRWQVWTVDIGETRRVADRLTVRRVKPGQLCLLVCSAGGCCCFPAVWMCSHTDCQGLRQARCSALLKLWCGVLDWRQTLSFQLDFSTFRRWIARGKSEFCLFLVRFNWPIMLLSCVPRYVASYIDKIIGGINQFEQSKFYFYINNVGYWFYFSAWGWFSNQQRLIPLWSFFHEEFVLLLLLLLLELELK